MRNRVFCCVVCTQGIQPPADIATIRKRLGNNDGNNGRDKIPTKQNNFDIKKMNCRAKIEIRTVPSTDHAVSFMLGRNGKISALSNSILKKHDFEIV